MLKMVPNAVCHMHLLLIILLYRPLINFFTFYELFIHPTLYLATPRCSTFLHQLKKVVAHIWYCF